jgi:hypothetical protein
MLDFGLAGLQGLNGGWIDDFSCGGDIADLGHLLERCANVLCEQVLGNAGGFQSG